MWGTHVGGKSQPCSCNQSHQHFDTTIFLVPLFYPSSWKLVYIFTDFFFYPLSLLHTHTHTHTEAWVWDRSSIFWRWSSISHDTAGKDHMISLMSYNHMISSTVTSRITWSPITWSPVLSQNHMIFDVIGPHDLWFHSYRAVIANLHLYSCMAYYDFKYIRKPFNIPNLGAVHLVAGTQMVPW